MSDAQYQLRCNDCGWTTTLTRDTVVSADIEATCSCHGLTAKQAMQLLTNATARSPWNDPT